MGGVQHRAGSLIFGFERVRIEIRLRLCEAAAGGVEIIRDSSVTLRS